MRAIILCAGLGSRLGSHTKTKPKCLVEFLGRTLLDWQTRALRQVGITDIILVGGYKKHLLERFNFKVAFNPRYRETNMLYSLLQAREDMLTDVDLLISYGDIIYEPRIVAELGRSRGDIVVAADSAWRSLWSLRFADPLEDAETFKTNQDGLLTEIGGTPQNYAQIDGQYRGLIKISQGYVPRFLDAAKALATADENIFDHLSMTEFLMSLIRSGEEINISWSQSGWLEFDNTTDLDLYTGLEQQGKLKQLFDRNSVEQNDG